jgi:hypothetical protein
VYSSTKRIGLSARFRGAPSGEIAGQLMPLDSGKFPANMPDRISPPVSEIWLESNDPKKGDAMSVGTNGEASIAKLRPQYWVAWVTLLLSLGLTFLAWRATVTYVNDLADSRFEARTTEAHTTFSAQIGTYAQALRGAQAYVGATGQPLAAPLRNHACW